MRRKRTSLLPLLPISAILLIFSTFLFNALIQAGLPPPPQVRQEPTRFRVIFDVTITTSEQPTRAFTLAFPVLREWPEQTSLQLLAIETHPLLRVELKDVPGVCSYAVVRAAMLPPDASVRARITYDVTLWKILPDWANVHTTVPARPSDLLRACLAPSAGIESDHPEIIQAAQSLLKGQSDDAAHAAERLYDFVRARIKYKAVPFRGALKALRYREGDCEQRAALFVALCRAAGIPARCVGTAGHTYAEFYVLPFGWLPAETAGSRWFAGLPDYRFVTVRGDGFSIPEFSREMTFFASRSAWLGGRPQVAISRTKTQLTDPRAAP